MATQVDDDTKAVTFLYRLALGVSQSRCELRKSF